MRILAGADFHGSLDHYRWFLGRARDLAADSLILAGDLLGFADEVDDTTVLVTHSPAYGVPDPGSGPYRIDSRFLDVGLLDRDGGSESAGTFLGYRFQVRQSHGYRLGFVHREPVDPARGNRYGRKTVAG